MPDNLPERERESEREKEREKKSERERERTGGERRKNALLTLQSLILIYITL